MYVARGLNPSAAVGFFPIPVDLIDVLECLAGLEPAIFALARRRDASFAIGTHCFNAESGRDSNPAPGRDRAGGSVPTIQQPVVLVGEVRLELTIFCL